MKISEDELRKWSRNGEVYTCLDRRSSGDNKDIKYLLRVRAALSLAVLELMGTEGYKCDP